jgi:hypothetical protein
MNWTGAIWKFSNEVFLVTLLQGIGLKKLPSKYVGVVDLGLYLDHK